MFYSMHVWVVSEDKWCSFCGALLEELRLGRF